MFRSIIIITWCLLLYTISAGQSISSSYVNPGFGTLENNIQLTYSIGDLFYGEVSSQDLYLTGMIYVEQQGEPPMALPFTFNQGISIFPNPCHNILYIQTEKNEQLILHFYSLIGVMLRQELIKYNCAFDLSDIPPGVYILKITDTEMNYYYTDKLIKAN